MYTICNSYLTQLIDEEENDKSSFGKAKFDKGTMAIVDKIK
jgi:hypothetical protein